MKQPLASGMIVGRRPFGAEARPTSPGRPRFRSPDGRRGASTSVRGVRIAVPGRGRPDLWALVLGVVMVMCSGPATAESTCPGDLTGNQIVGVEDLMLLLGAWGACDDPVVTDVNESCVGDINNDGVVDLSDLFILLAHWGVCSDAFSCAGNCAGQAPGGCWCDASCVGQGDCCPDACVECDHCMSGESCAGRCGDRSPDGCMCDALCKQFGDCCEDVCTYCPRNCPTDDCLDHCGGQSAVGCWCDALCHVVGDCCPDVCESCDICTS